MTTDLATEAGAAAPDPTRGASQSEPLLCIRGLTVEFVTSGGTIQAVNEVDLDLHRGEALGILGESGSGKSVTALAIMGLLDTPPARIPGGSATLNGHQLIGIPERQRRRLAGDRISMVFQDALTALNPVHPVGRQIGELFRVHRGMSRRDAHRAAVEMMDRVQIPDAASRARDYPHQFSGGMRQRIVIAMALALDPDVLIADEPTTALDVTVQAQILDLLAEQQRERQMGLIMITHDISVIREVTDQLAVMYAGRTVERGTTAEILDHPAHPYSRGLAASILEQEAQKQHLPAIPGQPPDPIQLPPGCSFAPRCTYVQPTCHQNVPSLDEIAPGHRSACFFADEVIGQ